MRGYGFSQATCQLHMLMTVKSKLRKTSEKDACKIQFTSKIMNFR